MDAGYDETGTPGNVDGGRVLAFLRITKNCTNVILCNTFFYNQFFKRVLKGDHLMRKLSTVLLALALQIGCGEDKQPCTEMKVKLEEGMSWACTDFDMQEKSAGLDQPCTDILDCCSGLECSSQGLCVVDTSNKRVNEPCDSTAECVHGLRCGFSGVSEKGDTPTCVNYKGGECLSE